MKPHICQESDTCSCSITGYEPNEQCPIHGAGEWPPRCHRCGRFIQRHEPDYVGLLEVTTMRDPSPLGL